MRAIADDDDEEDDEKQVVISPVGVRQSRNAAEPPQERPSVGYIVVLAAVVGLCYAGGVYAGRLRKGSALGAGGVELAGGVNRVAPRPAATAAPGPAAPDSPAAASGPLAMPPLLDGKCCVCGLDGPLECACLPRGTSLVFMGDLFTRAQYLDLVYSLKFGSFANWTRQPAKLVAPAVAEYGVHALALHNELAPEEWCNCKPFDLWRPMWTHFMENRYFHLPRCDVNISFFHLMPVANPAIEGHLSGEQAQGPARAEWLRKPLSTMRAARGWKWTYAWPDALRRVVAGLHPTVLVLGGRPPAYARVDYGALREAATAVAQCVLWMTAPRGVRAAAPPADAVSRGAAFAQPPTAVFDAARVVQEVAPDDSKFAKGHGQLFEAAVHRQVTMRLLRRLFGVVDADDIRAAEAGVGEPEFRELSCPAGRTFADDYS